MERVVFSEPSIMTPLARDFILIRVEVGQSPRLVELHKVTHVPTLLFMDQHGKEVVRLTGFVGASRLTKAAAYVTGGHFQRQDFETYESNH